MFHTYIWLYIFVLPSINSDSLIDGSHGIADFIFSRDFHMALPWMDHLKIFDKFIEGEYNSISLHFCNLRSTYFFISKIRC